MNKNNNSCRGIALIEVLVLIAIMGIFVALVVGGACGINISNGTGTKIGQLVKLSKQGFISKTWEAQIIRGGMNNGSGGFGTVPFDFTVESDADAAKLQQYMDKQIEVKINYRIEGLYRITRSESSGHFLVSVEPLTNSLTNTTSLAGSQ